MRGLRPSLKAYTRSILNPVSPLLKSPLYKRQGVAKMAYRDLRRLGVPAKGVISITYPTLFAIKCAPRPYSGAAVPRASTAW